MTDADPHETGQTGETSRGETARRSSDPGVAAGPPPPRGAPGAGTVAAAPATEALGAVSDALGALVRRVLGERSATDAYVAGVLGGQAERFHVDPLYFRIAVVVAAVLTRDAPVVPPLYALAWVVIPRRERPSVLGTIWRRSSLQEAAAAVLLAILASFVLIDQRLWVAAVLAVLAWALLDRVGAATGGEAGPEAPDQPAAEASQAGPASSAAASSSATTEQAAEQSAERPVEQTAGSRRPTGEQAVTWGRRRRGLDGPLEALRSRPVRAPRPRREPALWPLGLAAIVAVIVVFWTVDQTTAAGLDPSILVNLCLLVIGGVLALSGWKGRVGLLPLLLVPLAVPWLAFSVADVGRFAGSGEVVRTVGDGTSTSGEPVEVGYGTAQIRVPDGELEPGETIELSAGVTTGAIVLEVPENTNVIVEGRMGMGSVVHRSRHHWNTSFVVSDELDRRFPALQSRCGDSRRIEAWTAGWVYPEWSQSFPLLTDDGAALSPQFLAFLDDWALPHPELDRADPRNGPPVLTVVVDQFGQACAPDAGEPEQPSTVILDATLGLGELTIVHDR